MATIVNTEKHATIIAKMRRLYGSEALIYQGNLRVEKALSSNSNTYKFDLERSTSETTTEIKLSTQDVFAPVCWGLKLAKVPDGESIANSVLTDYPDLSIFNAADEAASLEAIYNGVLSSKSNSNEVFDFLSTQMFRFAPQTQGAAGLNVPQTPLKGTAPRTLYSNPIFQGSARCQVTLTVPVVGPAINAAGATNFVILYVDGFYVRGVDQAVTQSQAAQEGFILV